MKASLWDALGLRPANILVLLNQSEPLSESKGCSGLAARKRYPPDNYRYLRIEASVERSPKMGKMVNIWEAWKTWRTRKTQRTQKMLTTRKLRKMRKA